MAILGPSIWALSVNMTDPFVTTIEVGGSIRSAKVRSKVRTTILNSYTKFQHYVMSIWVLVVKMTASLIEMVGSALQQKMDATKRRLLHCSF